MRIAWYAVGLGGIASIASAAPFEVVIHTDLDNDFEITLLDQIVVQDDGYVATRLSTSSDGPAIVFNAASGNANMQTVAQQGDLVWGGTGAFDSFDDMALGGAGSSTRLTFGSTSGSGAKGIYQFQPSLNQQDAVAHDDVGQGSSPTLPSLFQVNHSGEVVYPINSGTESIQRYEPGTGNSVVLSDGDDDLTDFNSSIDKHAASGDGSAVFVATDTNTSTNNVYHYAIAGGETTVTGGISGYAPQQIVGANDSDVLYHAYDDVTGDSSLIINRAGFGDRILMEYTRPATNFLFPTGMISSNGKIAFVDQDNYEDSVGGDGDPANHIRFFDTADINTAAVPTLVAEVGDSIDGFTIFGLAGFGLTTPMVNDNGLVVFHAFLDDYETQALLSWTEATGLEIVAKTGDLIEVDGETYQIDAFAHHFIDSGADALKDGLSDTNVLAFGVEYSGEEGSGIAVLKTVIPVPEPAAVSLLALAAPLALRRRRR